MPPLGACIAVFSLPWRPEGQHPDAMPQWLATRLAYSRRGPLPRNIVLPAQQGRQTDRRLGKVLACQVQLAASAGAVEPQVTDTGLARGGHMLQPTLYKGRHGQLGDC